MSFIMRKKDVRKFLPEIHLKGSKSFPVTQANREDSEEENIDEAVQDSNEG